MVERGVDQAIFHLVDGFAVVQIIDLDVLVTHAVRFEHHAGVDLHARVRRADADTLALQIGEGLDAGVRRGDDLTDVRPESHHRPQIGRRLFALIGAERLNGLNDGVRHGDGHFALPGQQRIDVFRRRTGRRRRSAVAELADQGGKRAADGEINTAGGASEHGDVVVAPFDLLRRRLGRCKQCNGHGKRDQAKQATNFCVHFKSSFGLSMAIRQTTPENKNIRPKIGSEYPVLSLQSPLKTTLESDQ